MAEHDDKPSARNKVFPRNLTARAAYQVPGNPPSTRPESGVENAFPGLEFDTRNLETRFFPGLRVSFHPGDGARVDEVRSARGCAVERSGLTDADCPLHLWAVGGLTSFKAQAPAFTRFVLKGLNGTGVLRCVRALLPGPVSLLLGNAPGASAKVPAKAKEAFDENPSDDAWSRIERRNGAVAWALLVDVRAEHLDRHGVIDLRDHEPGELTQTLCAPWQFDFRDCGCEYWAANRPDMVIAEEGFTNFMRRNRAVPAERDDLKGPKRVNLTHAQVIGGAWNDVLAVVLNDRELPLPGPGPKKPAPPAMTVEQVIKELEYLATVEHALCVEYLFAHYSLRAPMVLPPHPPDEMVRIFAAAEAVFSVAVDEMRHLRWVNEALALLRQGPILGRAKIIGRVLKKPFQLLPLTAAQLDWFIEVEKPSQTFAGIDEDGCKETVDGMYVALLRNIEQQGKTFPAAERLVPLLKLIVDEGTDHYRRFLRVKEHLHDLPESKYLRRLVPGKHSAGVNLSAEQTQLVDRADDMYNDLLAELASSLRQGDEGGGMFLEHSRRRMLSLHEVNHRLANQELGPRFVLDARWSTGVE